MTSPDIGIQTNAVQKTSLPYLDSEGRYLIRYRIKTADGNLSTAWSPVYRATKPSIQSLFGVGGYNVDQKEIKSHGKSFDVSWKVRNSSGVVEAPEQIKDLPLDVYVKWDNQTSWTFVVTTTGNSFSIPIPEEYWSTATVAHNADFMVHLATNIKDRTQTDTNTLLFLAENQPTKATYDAGSIV